MTDIEMMDRIEALEARLGSLENVCRVFLGLDVPVFGAPPQIDMTQAPSMLIESLEEDFGAEED